MSGFNRPANRPADGKRRVSIRRVYELFRPHRKLTAAIVSLALVVSLLSLAPPLLFKSIIDTAIPTRNLPLLLWIGAGAATLTMLAGILAVWQSHLEQIVGHRIMRGLRIQTYSNIMKQSTQFFSESRSGEIIQRLTGDIQSVQTIVTRSAVNAITQGALWAASFLMLLMLEWKLAFIALLLLALGILPARQTAFLRKRILAECQNVKTDISAHLAETTGISGALLTRLYDNTKLQTDRYARLSDIAMRLELKMNLIGRWVTMLNGTLPAIGTVLIYVYGGFGTIQGTMTVGEMVAFAVYLSRLFGPTQQLLNLHADLTASLAVFERIFEYLDMRPDLSETSGVLTLPATIGHLACRNVTYRLPNGQTLLRDISFEVRRGEWVAIVGPSGSGKSTLLNLIARLLLPSAGTIAIDDRDIRDIAVQSLRERLVYVTQQAHLFHASIEGNLRFASPNAAPEALDEACRQAHIRDVIRSLPDGYATIVGERGNLLSGGEQQRIALARALLKQPSILLLDETTSNLDSLSEAAVQAAIGQLRRQCTVIVVAHRLSTITGADKIIVLDQGAVEEIGNHEELMQQNGLYANLYQLQHRPSASNG